MQIITVPREEAIFRTAQYIADTLGEALGKGKIVLWLVSGGSSLDVAVRTRELLGELQQPARLYVGLIDERFGEPGHSNSNWQQLIAKGFDTSGTILHPVLQDSGDIHQTAARYDQLLTTLLEQADVCIGLFGMGADGHTAGLLPHNPIMDTDRFVDSYTALDFERITITPKFIGKLDTAVLYAVGKEKWAALEQLKSDVSNDSAPVKLLYLAGELKVYTDYEGAIT